MTSIQVDLLSDLHKSNVAMNELVVLVGQDNGPQSALPTVNSAKIHVLCTGYLSLGFLFSFSSNYFRCSNL